MEVKRQYENQYCEENPTDEVWILVDGELKQIAGGEDDDDDSEKRQ